MSSSAAILAEETQVHDDLQALKDSFQEKALKIIHEQLPSKVELLDQLFKKHSGGDVSLSTLAGPPAPEFTAQGALCNSRVTQLMDELKNEINDMLVNFLDPLKMFVQLNIPKMQDQRGVNITVKEDIVEMLQGGKASAVTIMESMTKYHVQRGKLVSKQIKFPLAQEYVTCIKELDDKQYRMLLTMLLDLKSNYALIYDLFQKNLSKIEEAQDNDTYQSMY